MEQTCFVAFLLGALLGFGGYYFYRLRKAKNKPKAPEVNK